MNAFELFWSRPFKVFDLDGTLVDTQAGLWTALNEALDDLGLPPVPRHVVWRSLGSGMAATAEAALRHLQASGELLQRLEQRYCERYRDQLLGECRVYDAVPTVLQQVRDGDARIGVCTNQHEATARALLAGCGLMPWIDVVVGGDTLGQRKPHPAPLGETIRRLGGEPSQAVVVGYGRIDADCGLALGVPVLIFGGGYGNAFDGVTRTRTARFESYGELLPRMKRRYQPLRLAT